MTKSCRSLMGVRCSMAALALALTTALSMTSLSLAQEDPYSQMFHNPSQSSSYARVQYANGNQVNATRRIGLRDPTIQYVSFDELYNKVNSNNNNQVPPAVVLGSSSKTTISSKHDSHVPEDSHWSGSVAQDESHPGQMQVVDRTDAPSTTTSTTTTTTTTTTTASPPSADHRPQGQVHPEQQQFQIEPQHQGPQFHPEQGSDMFMAESSHSNMPTFLSNNKMDTEAIVWDDDRPDLTNGWTVERDGDKSVTEGNKSPQQVRTTTTAASISTTTHHDKPTSGLNQALDQVYAYSNAYKTTHDNRDGQGKQEVADESQPEVEMASTTAFQDGEDRVDVSEPTTTTTRETTVFRTNAASTGIKTAAAHVSFGVAQSIGAETGEYAHASFDGESAYGPLAAHDPTTTVLPVLVVEASWPPNQQKPSRTMQDRPRRPAPANDRIDVAIIDEQPSNHPPSKFLTPAGDSPPARRPSGPVAGVQSAWRPFNGPTIPPSTISPSTSTDSSKIEVIVQSVSHSSVDPPSSTTTDGSNTLFYGEAAKVAANNNERFQHEQQMFNNNQGPLAFNQQRPPMMMPPRFNNDRPPPMMMNGGGFPNQRHQQPPPQGMGGPQRPPMFNMRPDQQMSQQVGSQQMLLIPNVAENEISVAASSPSPASPPKPASGPDGENRPPMRFPIERPPQDRPPQMNNRPPFPFPPQQRPFMPPPSMNDQRPPQNRFPFRQPPPQQQWPSERPSWPGADRVPPPQPSPNSNGNQQEFGPPRDIPTGPVGLPPQLLPNVQGGRPSMLSLPAGQNGQDRINIPVPVPRPGAIGSSPQNPLPGPPIALPGVPAGPLVIADQNTENGPNGNRPPQRNGPPNNPQFNNNFQPDRSDSQSPDGPDNGNFIQGPPQQQGPFGHRNPNFPPHFRPPPNNFQQRPPPPQQQSSSSPTSLLKSLFSKFFPFARSLDDEGVPIVDYDAFINGSSLTVDPALYETLARSAENSSAPVVINVVDDSNATESIDGGRSDTEFSLEDLIHTSTSGPEVEIETTENVADNSTTLENKNSNAFDDATDSTNTNDIISTTSS